MMGKHFHQFCRVQTKPPLIKNRGGWSIQLLKIRSKNEFKRMIFTMMISWILCLIGFPCSWVLISWPPSITENLQELWRGRILKWECILILQFRETPIQYPVLPSTQWAAVRTHWSLMREQPHVCLGSSSPASRIWREPCHGHLPTGSTGSPPVYLWRQVKICKEVVTGIFPEWKNLMLTF